MFELLKNRKGLIIGIANSSSVAFSIAKTLKAAGAELALTYQNEVTKKRVVPIAEELGASIVCECDVLNQQSIVNTFDLIKSKWQNLDFIVHSLAYVNRKELQGRFIDTELENFLQAMHVSCYSLINIVKQAQELMLDKSSILTLSYYGAVKVLPNYNVMGVVKAALEATVRYLAADLGQQNVRVNAISAGPMSTLASSAIDGFKIMRRIHERVAPLKRNTTQEDVAKAALYLLSHLSSAVTGEIHYVDCGYNIIGMSCANEDISFSAKPQQTV